MMGEWSYIPLWSRALGAWDAQVQDRVEQPAVAPICPATWHEAEVRAAHLADFLGA